MPGYVLRIFHDRLPAHASARLPALDRVVYCVGGSARCEAGGEAKAIGADEAWHGRAEATVTAGPAETTLWRWEFLPESGLRDGKLRGEGVRSRDAGAYRLNLDPQGRYLMRCDRVNFPPGGEALTHVHAGPGVRSLLKGDLYIDSGGKQMVLAPGSTWVEFGPEEVYARASADEPTSFVRVMIIPRAYAGRSTITYTRAEDRDKPKSQQYQRYLEEPVELRP